MSVTQSNWWNRLRYRLYAPVYDWAAKPFETGRRQAIDRLDPDPDDRILILGCGTGMDLDYLPATASITAMDITPAMVAKTNARATDLGMTADTFVGDAASLPFEDARFDAVLLHLVLSVVPDPGAVMAETDRVLADDGTVSIFDKFSPESGKPALIRRVMNPIARTVFADLNRDLDAMLAGTSLTVGPRETLLGGLYTVTTAEHAP